MDSKSDFIMAAIDDCQATIRATDVKVGALLTGLLLPFSKVSQIWDYLEQLPKILDYNALTYLFFALWFLAICSLVRTISAIDNPSKHIVNNSACEGTFYRGGLYSFKCLDSLLNRDVIKANIDMTSFAATYPDTPDDIELELSFEHMKLIYIREIKLHRLNFSLWLSAIWFVAGLCAFFYLKSQ
ncbi:hypothetical protein [Photobacterium leiognathi]|uniref:hypothetical protein n=1 Tax=Photobacterium leiognathi TaxID=553611 RepID=UPI003AF3CFA3